MLFRKSLAALVLLLAAIQSSWVFAEDVIPSDRVTSGVHVRAEATSSSAINAVLRPGDTAEIIGDVPGWYQVRLPDGTEGFVSKSWTVRVDAQTEAALLEGNGYRVHVIDVGTGLPCSSTAKISLCSTTPGVRTISKAGMTTAWSPTSVRSGSTCSDWSMSS